jgi:hypothetical protein
MKNLEHIGNSFKVIARDPQILLDFHRGCQRFPESLKDPQGKGRKKKKQQYIYIDQDHLSKPMELQKASNQK